MRPPKEADPKQVPLPLAHITSTQCISSQSHVRPLDSYTHTASLKIHAAMESYFQTPAAAPPPPPPPISETLARQLRIEVRQFLSSLSDGRRVVSGLQVARILHGLGSPAVRSSLGEFKLPMPPLFPSALHSAQLTHLHCRDFPHTDSVSR